MSGPEIPYQWCKSWLERKRSSSVMKYVGLSKRVMTSELQGSQGQELGELDIDDPEKKLGRKALALTTVGRTRVSPFFLRTPCSHFYCIVHRILRWPMRQGETYQDTWQEFHNSCFSLLSLLVQFYTPWKQYQKNDVLLCPGHQGHLIKELGEHFG